MRKVYEIIMVIVAAGLAEAVALIGIPTQSGQPGSVVAGGELSAAPPTSAPTLPPLPTLLFPPGSSAPVPIGSRATPAPDLSLRAQPPQGVTEASSPAMGRPGASLAQHAPPSTSQPPSAVKPKPPTISKKPMPPPPTKPPPASTKPKPTPPTKPKRGIKLEIAARPPLQDLRRGPSAQPLIRRWPRRDADLRWPSLGWWSQQRRWRLWKTSRRSKIALVSSTQVFGGPVKQLDLRAGVVKGRRGGS